MLLVGDHVGHRVGQGQILETIDSQQSRRRGQHDGDEGGRRDVGELAHHLHVVHRRAAGQLPTGRQVAHLVVDHQQTERLAAGATELGLVHQAEQVGLVELDGAGQVAVELPPAGRQHGDAQPAAGRMRVHQPGQPAPGPLEALQARIMQDPVELGGDDRVDQHQFAVHQAAQGVWAMPVR